MKKRKGEGQGEQTFAKIRIGFRHRPPAFDVFS